MRKNYWKPPPKTLMSSSHDRKESYPAESKVRQLEKDITALSQEKFNLTQEIKARNEDIGDLVNQKNQLEETLLQRLSNRPWEAEKRHLEREGERLRLELAEANQKLEEQAQTVREAQQRAFRMMDSSDWARESDYEIQNSLADLERKMRQWSKDHVIKSFASLKLRQKVEREDRLLEEWSSFTSLKGDIFDHPDPILPRLILGAALSHFVYREIFANPFFWLLERLRNTPSAIALCQCAENAHLGDALHATLGEIIQGNPDEAHAWRSQLLRLLDPILPADQQERLALQESKDRTQKARTQVACRLTQEFLGTSARHLVHSSELDRAVEKLVPIFITASDFAYRLWLRKSSLGMLCMHQLPEKFHHTQPSLGAYPSHRKRLDDDERALDNMPILLVTHPAVMVYGNSDGSNPDVRRVWKKATVWMGSC